MSANKLSINKATIIAETCPYGILSIGEDDNVDFVNPAFCEISGIVYADIIDTPNHVLWKKLLEIYSIDGNLKTYIDGVLTLRSKDTLKVIRLNTLKPKSATIRQVYYLQDITAESEVDRMKTEFLSAAAHELRAPMSIIYGFTELLIANDFDKDATLDIISTVHNQAKCLTNIINELLDLTRIEFRQGKDFVMKEQSIANVILEIKKEWDGIADANRININIPSNTPLLSIDKEKIKQAVINVLSNACKFSSPDSPVNIEVLNSVKGTEQFIGIQVRDQGLGMTTEQLGHLFERFWRANATSNIVGSGLGLAIVKEIIEIHHGHIEVNSKMNQGTSITLWLPLTKEIKEKGAE